MMQEFLRFKLAYDCEISSHGTQNIPLDYITMGEESINFKAKYLGANDA